MENKKFIKPIISVVDIDADVICCSGPIPKQITRVDSGLDMGGSYDEEL